jgi:hypothetical protein
LNSGCIAESRVGLCDVVLYAYQLSLQCKLVTIIYDATCIDTVFDRLVALKALAEINDSSIDNKGAVKAVTSAAAAVVEGGKELVKDTVSSTVSSTKQSKQQRAAAARTQALGQKLHDSKERYRQEACDEILALDKSADLLKVLQERWLPAIEHSTDQLTVDVSTA